ncbi:hypothetical protein GH733_002188 [Mirounga leonina]|nr:hypothetical protein GH733_002188 [Mirounga leonina]
MAELQHHLEHLLCPVVGGSSVPTRDRPIPVQESLASPGLGYTLTLGTDNEGQFEELMQLVETTPHMQMDSALAS